MTRERYCVKMKSVWWVTASTLLAIAQCQVLDKVGEDTEFEERSIELPVSKLEQLKHQLDQEEEPRRRTFPGAGRLTDYVRGVLNNVRGLLQPPVASVLRTPLRGLTRLRKKPSSTKPDTTKKPKPPVKSVPEKEIPEIFQVVK